jgi:iron(III) transport system permease protein
MKGEAVYRPGVDVRLRRLWNRTSAVWTQPTVVIAAVLFILLTYLVIAPVTALVVNSVQVGVRDSAVVGLEPGAFTLYFLKRVFRSTVSPVLFWSPFFRTLLVALMTAALALPLGAALAWLVVRTDLPGRRWLSSAFVIPYILPSWTFAVVWLTLFKNRRLGGFQVSLNRWASHRRTGWPTEPSRSSSLRRCIYFRLHFSCSATPCAPWTSS